MGIIIKAAFGLFLFFIWILCRACTLADEFHSADTFHQTITPNADSYSKLVANDIIYSNNTLCIKNWE